MIDDKRKREAKANFDKYLEEGLIKKGTNPLAQDMYRKNAELSLKVAVDLSQNPLRPHLWVIVISYYSMFYMANAVLISLGYKTQDKIVHKVTYDALIVLILDRLKKELLEDFEKAQKDALEIASARAEGLVQNYALELEKRSAFQYNMLEETKQGKAETSLKRAKEFVYELGKLLDAQITK